jgi:MFS family permease
MAMLQDSATLLTEPHEQVTRHYAWTVFALTFGLALSDYLSRQVMSATFPFLKSEWGLSDARLGGLISVVAVSVAVFTIPVSLLADRWGRVKSITLMATAWCLATVACGLSSNYDQMLAARAVVGVSEAAYYSAGGALLAHVFPPRQRATVFGILLAGALFGSVLGVVLGGALATHFGWRQAFIYVGAPGLLIAVIYPLVVRDYGTVALSASERGGAKQPMRAAIADIARAVVGSRSAVYIYLASGLQMFMPGVLVAWLPSYLNRYYQMAPDRAAALAAAVILISGVGMTAGGIVADRLSAQDGSRRASIAAIYSALAAVLLIAGFWLEGTTGLAFICLGALLVGGHAGCSSAIVTEVTHPAIRATVMATMILGNNLLGFAPGPIVVGWLSDALQLKLALCVAPLSCLLAVVFFLRVAKLYPADSVKFSQQ